MAEFSNSIFNSSRSPSIRTASIYENGLACSSRSTAKIKICVSERGPSEGKGSTSIVYISRKRNFFYSSLASY